MPPGYPGNTTRAEQNRRNNPVPFTASSLCVFLQRNLVRPDDPNQTDRPYGVSTYLALTFGTLLSSQGADASFETVSPVSPGASLRCFTRYQTDFISPNPCFSRTCES